MVDPTTSRPARGVFAVLGIFALGIVFGVSLSFVFVHHADLPGARGPRHGGPQLGERMIRQLDLDADQQEKIRPILERGRAKMRSVLDETRRDIRSELHPDQQRKFDRMHRRRSPR